MNSDLYSLGRMTNRMFHSGYLQSIPLKISICLMVTMLLVSIIFHPVKASSIPTVSIVHVIVDKSVTIRTNNFPANVQFTVRMGEMGTHGVNGIIVGTLFSGPGGTFDVTLDIPDELKGKAQIAIRLESANGYFAYDWFNNNIRNFQINSTSYRYSTHYGIPNIEVLRIDEEQNITVMGINFPSYQMFTVRMGTIGTKGINGAVVAVVDTGLGGAFETSFKIPGSMLSQSKLAVRMENENGYYAYNWFSTTESQTIPVSLGHMLDDFVFLPMVKSISVIKDTSVLFHANNIPSNQEFSVRLGNAATKAVNDGLSGSIYSIVGGRLEKTADIPREFSSEHRITIRIDSDSGYYAYNWFYNTST